MRLLVALFALITIISAAQAYTCTFSSNGDNYDFSAMKNVSAYTYKGPMMGAPTFYWNICDVCQQCQTTLPETGACQISGGTWNPIGSVAQSSFAAITDQNAKGATLTYGGGPACSSGQERTTNLRLQCSDAPTQIVSVAENTKCIYDILMTSKLACPGASGSGSGGSGGSGGGGKKGGIGGGWVFIIILLVSITVYIGVGIGVNYKVRGLRGREMFPNIEFWSEVPGYIKDGALFIKGKITGSGGAAGYQQV